MDLLLGIGLKYGVPALGVLAGGKLLDFVLKRFITVSYIMAMQEKIGKAAFALGRTVTLGMVKWPPTAKFWNQTIEPYFVLLLSILEPILPGFRKGLSSDNGSLKDD